MRRFFFAFFVCLFFLFCFVFGQSSYASFFFSPTFCKLHSTSIFFFFENLRSSFLPPSLKLVADQLWVLYTAQETTPNQWCSINVTNNAFSCYQFDSSDVYQAESSAYDARNHMLYAQVSSLSAENDGNYLVGFDTVALKSTPAVRMGELCSNMEVAYDTNNAALVLCVRFVTNDVVKVDVATGKTTTVLLLPPLHDPVPHANAVRNSPASSPASSSYFLQLQGPAEYHWVEIDVATHKVVSNSSLIVMNNLPLAMTVYV